MKAPKKISYSEDVDILLIQLTNKKIDDAYETDQMLVHVDKQGEPVLLEIFHATKFLKDINQKLPKSIQSKILPENIYTSVAHRIK